MILSSRAFSIFSISIMIAACGGGGSESDAQSKPVQCPLTPAFDVAVTASGETMVVNRADVYQLNVSGSINTITIQPSNSVSLVSVSGDGNTVTVNDGAVLCNVTLTGKSNTISLPRGSTAQVIDQGSINSIRYR